MFRQFFAVPFRQLQIELHETGKDFVINDFFAALAKRGYTIFHKEANTLAGASAIEYALVKLRPDTTYVPGTGEALSEK